MVAQVQVARVANRDKVGIGVVLLVMVNMVNLQGSFILFWRLTAALADIAVSLSDSLLELIAELDAVRLIAKLVRPDWWVRLRFGVALPRAVIQILRCVRDELTSTPDAVQREFSPLIAACESSGTEATLRTILAAFGFPCGLLFRRLPAHLTDNNLRMPNARTWFANLTRVITRFRAILTIESRVCPERRATILAIDCHGSIVSQSLLFSRSLGGLKGVISSRWLL